MPLSFAWSSVVTHAALGRSVPASRSNTILAQALASIQSVEPELSVVGWPGWHASGLVAADQDWRAELDGVDSGSQQPDTKVRDPQWQQAQIREHVGLGAQDLVAQFAGARVVAAWGVQLGESLGQAQADVSSLGLQGHCLRQCCDLQAKAMGQ